MTTGEAQPTFADGEIVADRFRIVRFIAQGGMGEVYEAYDSELDVTLALKTIRQEISTKPSTIKRFRREIKLARQVTHGNVCRIYDFFTHTPQEGGDPRFFLTMELLQGETLHQRLLREGKLPQDKILDLLKQMVAGLSTAHHAGVVHRDFKSANIFLVPEPDGSERVVITDFGLARSSADDQEDESELTAEGKFIGTPAFISPEQLHGSEPSISSDIYSLGVVLYEMVTGRRPFEGPNPLSTAIRRLFEEPTSPSKHVDNLDPRLERVISRCLRRDPAQRFQQAEEILAVVTGRAGIRVSTRALVLGMVLVVGCVVVGLSFLLWPSRHSGRRQQRPSLAILGFRNLEDRSESAWLSSALTEMLSTELAAGEQLRLASGEDVARARIELQLPEVESFSTATLARLRALLDCEYVITGSFLVTGEAEEQIRVDLRVQDAVSGAVVVSLVANSDEGELSRLVNRANSRVRQRLGVGQEAAAAAAEKRTALPRDAKAKRLYTQGLERLWAFDTVAARDLLLQAAQTEPDFPLVWAALSKACSSLGYEKMAAEAAEKALDLSEGLPREGRLIIEAQYHESRANWTEAINIIQSLRTFFPDNRTYAEQLAEAYLASGAPQKAKETIVQLRRSPGAEQRPQLDLLEAEISGHLSDYSAQRDLARRAAASARRLEARLLLGRALLMEGDALWSLGESTPALAAYNEAVTVLKATGHRKAEAAARVLLGKAHVDEGRLDRAEDCFRSALALSTQIGDVRGKASALRNFGNLALRKNDLEKAERFFSDSLAIHRETGDVVNQARDLLRRAAVLRRQGDLEAARAAYQDSYEAFVASGHRSDGASALNSMAIVFRQQLRLEEAAEAFERVIAIRQEIGDRRKLAIPLVNLGNVQLDLGNLERSKLAFRQALELAREVSNPRHVNYALFGLGEVVLAQGNLNAARLYHQEALDLRRQAGEAAAVANSLLSLAMIDIEAGDATSALDRVRKVLDILADTPSPDVAFWAHAVQSRAALAAGKLTLARRSARTAVAELAGSGDRTAAEFLDFTLARLEVAEGQHALASGRLRNRLEATIKTGTTASRIECLLILGEAELHASDREAARQHLVSALDLARKTGFRLHEEKATRMLEQLEAQTTS